MKQITVSEQMSTENEGMINNESNKDKNKSYKRKVIETAVLCCGFLAIGNIFGLTGPTFLDLEILTGGTTDQVSFTFIGRAVSSFLGALVAGATISRYNSWLLLGCSTFLLTFFQGFIPSARSIPILAVVNILRGFECGFNDAGANVTLLNIWKEENGLWMQALCFLYGVGGLLAPLLAKPFIYTPPADDTNTTTISSNSSIPGNETTTSDANINVEETKVWIAYFITSVYLFLVTLAFLCIYVSGERRFLQIHKKEEKEKDTGQREEHCLKFTIISLAMMLIFTYAMIENNYFNFVVVYLVKHVGYSKEKATSMNAAIWASFTAGRALGIGIVLVVKPQIMLALSVTGTLLFLAPQPFADKLPEWVLWMCIIGLGLSMSMTFATAYSWTDRYIHLVGMVGATLVVAGIFGELTGPLMIGILYKTHGACSLMYFIFGTSCLMMGVFIILQIVAHRYGEKNIHKYTKNEVSVAVPMQNKTQ